MDSQGNISKRIEEVKTRLDAIDAQRKTLKKEIKELRRLETASEYLNGINRNVPVLIPQSWENEARKFGFAPIDEDEIDITFTVIANGTTHHREKPQYIDRDSIEWEEYRIKSVHYQGPFYDSDAKKNPTYKWTSSHYVYYQDRWINEEPIEMILEDPDKYNEEFTLKDLDYGDWDDDVSLTGECTDNAILMWRE